MKRDLEPAIEENEGAVRAWMNDRMRYDHATARRVRANGKVRSLVAAIRLLRAEHRATGKDGGR